MTTEHFSSEFKPLKQTLVRLNQTRWLKWAGSILLVGYAVFIGAHFAPVAAGADSGGYFNSAKLLAAGKLVENFRLIPEASGASRFDAAVPLGYLNEPGSLVLKPTYPVGLPMHYAAAGKILGWYWGPLFIGVAGTVLAVLFCFLCLREYGVNLVLSIAGTVSLAISPMLLFCSSVPMADSISTMWCTAAVFFALRARRSLAWAFACGLAFSIAVLVRPTCALLGPSLGLILWNWRALWRGVIGGLPGAIWAAFYNKVMYGSPFRTGYGSILDAFTWPSVIPSLKNYLETFPYVLPLVIPALLLAPFLPWRQYWRELTAAFLWWLGLVVFYAFYNITQLAWWYLRFVLPVFPLIVVCGMLGIQQLLLRLRSREWAQIGIAAFVVLLSGIASIRCIRERHVMLMKEYQQPYVAVCDWARANLPKDTVMFCMQTSSAFYFYTELPIIRWDGISPADFGELGKAVKRTGRPVYATLFPFEADDALKRLLPGTWKKITDVKGVGIWRFTPPD